MLQPRPSLAASPSLAEHHGDGPRWTHPSTATRVEPSTLEILRSLDGRDHHGTPGAPTVVALIMKLEAVLTPLYPTESRHGLSVERLIAEGAAFFVLRSDGAPASCGGIKLFGTDYGEVKRHERPPAVSRGWACEADPEPSGRSRPGQRREPARRLETGIHQKEAIGLYEGLGFRRIPPFGAYKPDPVSLCYEKRIG